MLKQMLVAGLATAVLAACSSLPRGAALESEIIRERRGEPSEFAVYPVTKSFLPVVARWPGDPAANRRWLPHGHGRAQVIQPGDVVNMVIWDSDDNSLLTAPEQKSTKMEPMLVSRQGTIFMPYIDKVHIAGLSADAARQKIQRQLEDIIPSAQVQLALAPGVRQAVDLVGGVNSPGNYPLADIDGHVTVLGLISQGGGVRDGLDNPQVTLTRSGSVYRIALDQLYDNPSYDTILRGRDKVVVTADDRFFRSLGAAQTEGIIPFDRETVTALDAVSMVGGLRDTRADPGSILILREYGAHAVKPGGPTNERVIFAVNLTTADGLFSAGKFRIHPGDTVMVTEAPVTVAETIIGLFTGALRTANLAGG